MKIAEKIKTARNRAGMSQQELADAIHVSRSAVAKWESDKGLPDIENLKSIAKLFGMTLDELAGEGEQVHCTLREPMSAGDPEEAVRARWPEAVRIDSLFLRHDFDWPGRILNFLSVGILGGWWRIFHHQECDADRYYLVDNFDEHIFVRAHEGELYISPLGRRVLRSELDTFRHERRTYLGGGKLQEKERVDPMKKYWSLYSNGTYQIGCQEHCMYLYDGEGRELARFKDLRYAPRGAFQPGTNIFVLRSTEGRLAVYDCDERKLLRKWNFSKIHYAQDDGFCFTPDGRYFLNIERSPTEYRSRLAVYETEKFTLVKYLFEEKENVSLSGILYDESRDQVQLLYFTRDAEGCRDQCYVGVVVEDRLEPFCRVSPDAFDFLASWMELRICGFTEKAMEWSGLHYDGYTNDQIRTLRDRELDLCTFDLEKVLEDFNRID